MLKEALKGVTEPKDYKKLVMQFDSTLTQLHSEDYIMNQETYLQLRQKHPLHAILNILPTDVMATQNNLLLARYPLFRQRSDSTIITRAQFKRR
jgi:hypothetical protein